jgi:UDP-glucuronate decarboxylase
MNIGNPTEFTVSQLAQMIIEITGSSSEVIHEALPVDDPTQRRPDISLARSALGWEPRVPIREGLARTVSYFETGVTRHG